MLSEPAEPDWNQKVWTSLGVLWLEPFVQTSRLALSQTIWFCRELVTVNFDQFGYGS